MPILYTVCILLLCFIFLMNTVQYFKLKAKSQNAPDLYDSQKKFIVPTTTGDGPPKYEGARHAGESCKPTTEECDPGLTCRRLVRDIVFGDITLQSDFTYCVPGIEPACTVKRGGQLVLSYDRIFQQYRLLCNCTKPQYFTGNNEGDCNHVTACADYVPGTDTDIKTLKCICNEKWEIFKDYNNGGPVCSPVNFFTSAYDPLSYETVPKMEWQYVSEQYRRLFRNIEKRSMPDPCRIDGYSGQVLPTTAAYMLYVRHPDGDYVRCQTNNDNYIPITFNSDYLIGNDGRYPNGIIQTSNYGNVITGYEFGAVKNGAYGPLIPFKQVLKRAANQKLLDFIPWDAYGFKYNRNSLIVRFFTPITSEEAAYEIKTQFPYVSVLVCAPQIFKVIQHVGRWRWHAAASYMSPAAVIVAINKLHTTQFYITYGCCIEVNKVSMDPLDRFNIWEGISVTGTRDPPKDESPAYVVREKFAIFQKIFNKRNIVQVGTDNVYLNSESPSFTGIYTYVSGTYVLVPCYHSRLLDNSVSQIRRPAANIDTQTAYDLTIPQQNPECRKAGSLPHTGQVSVLRNVSPAPYTNVGVIAWSEFLFGMPYDYYIDNTDIHLQYAPFNMMPYTTAHIPDL